MRDGPVRRFAPGGDAAAASARDRDGCGAGGKQDPAVLGETLAGGGGEVGEGHTHDVAALRWWSRPCGTDPCGDGALVEGSVQPRQGHGEYVGPTDIGRRWHPQRSASLGHLDHLHIHATDACVALDAEHGGRSAGSSCGPHEDQHQERKQATGGSEGDRHGRGSHLRQWAGCGELGDPGNRRDGDGCGGREQQSRPHIGTAVAVPGSRRGSAQRRGDRTWDEQRQPCRAVRPHQQPTVPECGEAPVMAARQNPVGQQGQSHPDSPQRDQCHRLRHDRQPGSEQRRDQHGHEQELPRARQVAGDTAQVGHPLAEAQPASPQWRSTGPVGLELPRSPQGVLCDIALEVGAGECHHGWLAVVPALPAGLVGGEGHLVGGGVGLIGEPTLLRNRGSTYERARPTPVGGPVVVLARLHHPEEEGELVGGAVVVTSRRPVDGLASLAQPHGLVVEVAAEALEHVGQRYLVAPDKRHQLPVEVLEGGVQLRLRLSGRNKCA